ncbi:hypothetical protein V1282_002656 [Nitrobacteraceae bacterium AZCC 2146]
MNLLRFLDAISERLRLTIGRAGTYRTDITSNKFPPHC